MAKREQRHLRRRQEIAERRRTAKEAGQVSESERLLKNNRWVYWVPNVLPFAVMVVGYALIYLFTWKKQVDNSEIAGYFIGVVVVSFFGMLARTPLTRFLIGRLQKRAARSEPETEQEKPS